MLADKLISDVLPINWCINKVMFMANTLVFSAVTGEAIRY